jgi:DNA helicase-2/ATP-dependent DNA helicase PcrA
MRATVQPNDDLAFERIVNVPRRGVGESALRTMHEAARTFGIPLAAAAARLVETGGLRGKLRDSIATLLRNFSLWRERLDREGHVMTVAAMLDESGYTDMWKQDKSPEAPGRLENLKELVRALAEFETLGGFLEHVSLVMENEENAGDAKVSLMTLHGAKGLEFDTVFLPGWEEGVFPNQRSMDESGLKGLEEERRLAYVGLTRARRRAIVSHAANRRIYANWQSSIPSRFLEEIPEDYVATSGSAALARDARIAAPPSFGMQFPLVARRVHTIEPWEKPARPAQTAAIPVGARVFHQKFGYGTVKAADDDKLDIAFENAGHKRVLDRFVERV